MGKHDIYTENLSDYEAERHIYRIEVHPKYTPRTMENDIAILVLDSPVVEAPTKHIRWACLDHGIDIYEEMECFISGWGVTKSKQDYDYDFFLRSSLLAKLNVDNFI